MNVWSGLGSNGLFGAVLMLGVLAGVFHASQGRLGLGVIAVVAVVVGAVVLRDGVREAAFAKARERAGLIASVSAPASPIVISVIGAQGVCPQGYRPGMSFRIDEAGNLMPPLCRPAIVALAPVLQGEARTDESPPACRCPFGPQTVSFAIASAA